MSFAIGARVHVPGFGTGLVREVRNGGRYLVEIKGRAMVVRESQLSAAPDTRRTPTSSAAPSASDRAATSARVPELDLHGRTVDEAIELLDRFINDALVAGASEARVIHGRSGGRLKAAVHARLKEVLAVRRFRVDPTNPGVTHVGF